MIKKLLPAIAVLLAMNGVAQTYPLSRFTDTIPPKVSSAGWYSLNHSRDLRVSLTDGALSISDYKWNGGSTTFTLPDGELIGVDHGEWGGGLYYAPTDTTRKFFFINGQRGPASNDPFRGGLLVPPTNPISKLVKDKFLIARGNVKFIFPYNNGVSFIEGLAHMGLSFGALYKLDIQKDSFTVSKTMDFKDAPMAMAVYNGIIYVATDGGFYTIHNLTQEQVFTDLFWSSLYPNSIAVADEHHIYVGMRGGYAVIDAPEKKLKFYQYTP